MKIDLVQYFSFFFRPLYVVFKLFSTYAFSFYFIFTSPFLTFQWLIRQNENATVEFIRLALFPFNLLENGYALVRLKSVKPVPK